MQQSLPQQPAPADVVYDRHASGKKVESEIIVDGAEGVQVILASCCQPVPGDTIIGYTTRVRGITIHRVDCRNLKNAHTERAIEVSWGAIPQNKRYVARLKLDASDRSGLFADIAQAIMAAEGGIVGIKASVVGGNIARMKVEIKVRNLEHLYAVIARLNTVKNVIEITRG